MGEINFNCSDCGQNLDAPDDMAGQEIVCPACDAAIVIAAPGIPEETEPAPMATPKTIKKFVVKKKTTRRRPAKRSSGQTRENDGYTDADDEDLPVITPEPMEKTISEKSRLATLLLCASPWALLGMHRFYVGKKGSAFGQIFTLGGLGIWILIDLVRILLGSFTDKQNLPLKRW